MNEKELIENSNMVFEVFEMYTKIHSHRIICNRIIKKDKVRVDNDSFLMTSDLTFKDFKIEVFKFMLLTKYDHLHIDNYGSILFDYDDYAYIMLDAIRNFALKKSEFLSLHYQDLHLILFQNEESKNKYIKQKEGGI